MSTATLKKSLGEAGAFIDESNGSPSPLHAVLKALAESTPGLDAHQPTVATGVIGATIIDKDTILTGLRTALAVCGSVGDTTVIVRKNGVAVTGATLTTNNAEADGTKKATAALSVECVAGDLIELVVTVAPTGGTGLTARASFSPVTVEE
jgi:hypothetical protein